MLTYILLGVSFGLPVILGLLWKVKTSYIFFSLLAGELLARYFSDDAELVIKTLTNNESYTSYAALIVLALPVIFTAVFLKGTLEKGMLVFHFIPLLITGIVSAAFAIHFFPQELIAEVALLPYGQEMIRSTEVVVGVIVLLQLVALWLEGRRHTHKKKKH